MSLIGPRPMVKNNFDYYDEKDKEIIASVRPGLSGIGSVIFRDEETILGKIANREEFYRLSIAPYKAELEKWFVSNYSTRILYINNCSYFCSHKTKHKICLPDFQYCTANSTCAEG